MTSTLSLTSQLIQNTGPILELELCTLPADMSCHLFGKCATSEGVTICHGVPYEGNCCDPSMKCYFLDANRTESKCMATCDNIRQTLGEGGKLCEEVTAVTIS